MTVRTAPVTRGLGEVTAGPEPVRKESRPLPEFDDGWKVDARCKDADPALFIAFDGQDAMSALAYCVCCPVVAECNGLAELHDSHGLPVSGVWGGRVWTTSGRKSAPNMSRTARLSLARGGKKRCRKCDVSKPTVGFHQDRTKPDGLTDWCRDCRSEWNRRAS